MAFPIPHLPHLETPAAQPPAMFLHTTREDVLWNRPVFKAPPLQLHPQAFDTTRFAQDLPRVGSIQR